MSMIQDIRRKAPAHPGGFVKSEIIEALGLSVTDQASALGVTGAALSALVNERAHLSSEMALRIEKAFGVSMDTLMRMQNSFDIAKALKREGDQCRSFQGSVARSATRARLNFGERCQREIVERCFGLCLRIIVTRRSEKAVGQMIPLPLKSEWRSDTFNEHVICPTKGGGRAESISGQVSSA